MSHTLTIRLTEELLSWLKETSRQTGVPWADSSASNLRAAKSNRESSDFLRHAGAISGGPSDVSSRKGFLPIMKGHC